MLDTSETVSKAAGAQIRRKQMFEMLKSGGLSIIHTDKEEKGKQTIFNEEVREE